MDKQLQKLIELSNKTGDRLIVFDPNNKNSAYIVMGIEDYERMAIGRAEVRGLTEDELLDKINRDIAIWKSDKVDDVVLSETNEYSDDDAFTNEFEPDNDDWYSIDEIAQKSDYINQDDKVDIKKRKAWSIPSDRKKKAEEIIEEDRYYLEDVED